MELVVKSLVSIHGFAVWESVRNRLSLNGMSL